MTNRLTIREQITGVTGRPTAAGAQVGTRPHHTSTHRQTPTHPTT
ncbi:hypothetical protein OOK13_27985 [Streptomyces sp. NBC_00378]|nr:MULTISPECIES: hypothetical protein [unclassified Streptomyces]MCX5112298.1 hypothetical protein [Streptomyces sp. NBC_00378]